MAEARTVAFHTLGCKLNYSETSTLARMLEKEGFEKRSFEDLADVYVINTCSVTENADRECRQLVRRIQRQSPHSFVVVTGCYAQLKPNEISEIPGVDLVLGAAEKFNLTQHLRQLKKEESAKICSCDIEQVTGFHSSWSVNDRTRTFLKVQDGCDYSCSFCTIPLARGKSRSDSIQNVVREAEQLASLGTKEIVLTGVNLGDFGSSLPTSPDGGGLKNDSKNGKENFLDLLKELEKLREIHRYRISSIEPNLLTDNIIDFVADSDKFMPHFHIPLQSGSNTILALMRRRYKKELYADRVNRIKTLIPHCCIGVDVIAGFPSETDDNFRETLEFLHSLDVSYLHVFTYSERDNTQALSITPVIPRQVRHERNKILRNLSYKKMQYFIAQHTGQVRKVLFEGQHKGVSSATGRDTMEGYTDNYIRVTAPYKAEWVNNIIDWRI